MDYLVAFWIRQWLYAASLFFPRSIVTKRVENVYWIDFKRRQ